MFGTLRGALDVRQVKLQEDGLQADVEGIHQMRDGLPILTEIKVHYRLRIPQGSRETVDRALSRHLAKCPTAHSLQGAVALSWTADIQEVA